MKNTKSKKWYSVQAKIVWLIVISLGISAYVTLISILVLASGAVTSRII